MNRLPGLLAIAALMCSEAAFTGEQPAAGKLLVASEDADGSRFERTVILLLHYDEFGAQGLVINRESDAELADVFPQSEALASYKGALFWGGPVQMSTMRALLRTDDPPDDAIAVIDDVYRIAVDKPISGHEMNDAHIRFFIGYAGWSPGQLDRELRFGNWTVVTGDADVVFSADPASVWSTLRPAPQLRVNLRAAAGNRDTEPTVTDDPGG